MKKRNIVATSSIAVALFLGSYGSIQAANNAFYRPRLYSQTQGAPSTEIEGHGFGVSASDFKEDLGLDPTFTQSLIEQGFNPSQIQKIFASASLKNDYEKLPLEE